MQGVSLKSAGLSLEQFKGKELLARDFNIANV